MKKILGVVLLLAVLVTMFGACAPVEPAAPQPAEPAAPEATTPDTDSSTQDANKEYVVAYILNSVDDWAQTYVNAGTKRCEEYGFKALSMNPESDIQKQIDYVQSAISQKVDMIAIQPIDNAAIAPILKKANEAGILVNSLYQIEPELGLDFIVFTTYGQFEAGQIAAEAMVEAIGEKGKVGIIGGNAGASNTRLRSEGFRNIIDKYPDITIVNEIACSWDRSKAMAAADDMITANPDLVGIFSMGDQMAHGVIESVAGMNKSEQIKIVCVDAGRATQQAVLDGKLAAAVDCPPDWFSEMAADVLKMKVDGKPIEQEYIYQPKAITKDNADPASAPY